MTGELGKQQLSAPPNAFTSVYIASKTRHAEKIKALEGAFPRVYFTARWPRLCHMSSEAVRPVTHWQNDNFSDIARSEVILVYAEDGDELYGALIEVGYAFPFPDKLIYVVGSHKAYSHWQSHNRVRRKPTLEAALEEISKMKNYED